MTAAGLTAWLSELDAEVWRLAEAHRATADTGVHVAAERRRTSLRLRERSTGVTLLVVLVDEGGGPALRLRAFGRGRGVGRAEIHLPLPISSDVPQARRTHVAAAAQRAFDELLAIAMAERAAARSRQEEA